MLSVVIPTYNRANYLSKALASLVEQDFAKEKFEVIVVDDGSIDDTEKTAKQFKDRLSLKYLKEEHGGVSQARNSGVKNSGGEIIVFFDDDALADKNWLKNISEIMLHEAIITGRVKPLNNNLWQYFAPHYYQGDQPTESPVLLEGNCAIKREVFAKVGLFDANLDYGHEGREFIGRCRKEYKIRYYPDVIIYHDYASSIKNYLDKQRKFGEKTAYLKIKEIKNFGDLIFNYQKIKSGDSLNSFTPFQKPSLSDRLKVKMIAKLGGWYHFMGAVRGYLKYKQNAKN
ncbi:MAG: glycosyltransferase family A protein [Patescibacteria group bacterium]